ncbi:15630_t:CDS:2, partial [Acaulospora colombiana]
GLSSDPIIHGTGSGDETDHSGRLSHVSVKSFQSTQTNGSLGLNTPPPTEVDEDYRATRRRLAREARKADELAAALPQRLRSSTIRGDSPSQPTPVATRPAAMALFETLSSSPASISSVQPSSSPFTSRHAPRDSSASRPSPSIEDNSSRIEILRRNSSLSGSDRSLSRPRPSSNDETQILRDQYEGWKSNIRDHSDAVFRNAEKQLEESKVRFQKEQQEKHARAQALFVAQQEKLYHQLSRNRAGSAGSAALNIAPGSSHPRSGSFAMPGQGHGLPSSASPTLQRGVHPSSPVPPSISPNHPLQSKQSQTFQMAATTSSHAPLHRSQSRTWLPAGASPSVKQTTDFGNRHSGGSSDTDEAENAVEDDESDAPIQFAQHKGSLPISIPNSTAGHRRTSSQIHTGATTMSVGPSQHAHRVVGQARQARLLIPR